MKVTVVLVAFYGDEWLPRCLASLSGACMDRLHLVLVDNDGNRAIEDQPLGEFETELIRAPRPMGFAEANNYELVEASHLEDAVLFLNQDTINTSNWISHCRDLLEAHPNIGALSPMVRTYDDAAWDPSFLACLSAAQRQEIEASPPSAFLEADAVPAPALLVRKDVLRRTGPFDPVFGSYYEDYDLCRRVRLAGFRVGFAGQARIMHFSGSTTDSAARELRRTRQIIRNRVIHEVRSNLGGRRRVLLRTFFVDFPRRVGRGLLRTRTSQPVSTTLGAYSDLVRLMPRLASVKIDEKRWDAYLDLIGWNEV